MEWKVEQTDHKPESVEISGDTVTQRRNIREVEVSDPDGNVRTAYESEMRFLSTAEYLLEKDLIIDDLIAILVEKGIVD